LFSFNETIFFYHFFYPSKTQMNRKSKPFLISRKEPHATRRPADVGKEHGGFFSKDEVQ
jgi:hypothetical protein